MVDVSCRHGTLSATSSDNGKPFGSKLWKGVLKPMGIDERQNTPVKHAIIIYCASHRDCDKRLPEVAFAMRTTERIVTGFSATKTKLGRPRRDITTEDADHLSSRREIWCFATHTLSATHVQASLQSWHLNG